MRADHGLLGCDFEAAAPFAHLLLLVFLVSPCRIGGVGFPLVLRGGLVIDKGIGRWHEVIDGFLAFNVCVPIQTRHAQGPRGGGGASCVPPPMRTTKTTAFLVFGVRSSRCAARDAPREGEGFQLRGDPMYSALI
eukprot:Polyplicarium_translucidae@DN3104_c0_g1_i4.p3